MEKNRYSSYKTHKKSNKSKHQKKSKNIIHCKCEKTNNHHFKYHSNKNIHLFNHLHKSSNNNITSINSNFNKDLSEMFSLFIKKKKFKISNNFDERHSKKFLDKKNKCLEKIILSDIIENNIDRNTTKDSFYDISKRKFKTEKNINKYFIIITNYDEEIKNNNIISKC